jgi:hypothetical protein
MSATVIHGKALSLRKGGMLLSDCGRLSDNPKRPRDKTL